MNLKKSPKETAYVKIILPRTLLPYKNATRSNRTAEQAAEARKKYGKIGVSRGGKNTKIHALVTENFQLIGLLLTGGIIHRTRRYCLYPRQSQLHCMSLIETFTRRAMSLNVWIKNRRRIDTRYDKLAGCSLNFVILSALFIQI